MMAIGLTLALAACGGTAAPLGSPSAPPKPASSASAAPSSASAKPAASAKPQASPNPAVSAPGSAASPEKAHLEVAIAAPAGSSYTTLWVAKDAGYFAKHGLDVNFNVVSASVATQALISGQTDIYMGGTAPMAGHLAGADIIYAAALVDKSELMLIGQKGITTVDGLKGKGVSTTSPGAFGEIAMRKTAKEHGLEVGKDIKMLFHPTPAAALTTFLTQPDNAGGIIITPPENADAINRGYPVIVDYYKEGLRLIGPGASVMRPFYKQNPNAMKAFLESVLDGVKRSLDDPAYFKELDSRYGKLSDPKLLDADFTEGAKVWNKDMTVKPAAIQVALDASNDPKARTTKPDEMYDNTIIQQVNREYASKLFPGEVKG